MQGRVIRENYGNPHRYIPVQLTDEVPLITLLLGENVSDGTLIFRTATAYFHIAEVNPGPAVTIPYVSPGHCLFSILRLSDNNDVSRIILPRAQVHRTGPIKFVVLSRGHGGYTLGFDGKS